MLFLFIFAKSELYLFFNIISSSPAWFVSKRKYKIEFIRSVLSTDILNNFPADIELTNGIPFVL